ncbi:MAG TPA: hypothetical protein DHW61_13685 [Lachnoclostridium phytofermentans]|uniref:Uncharacterized protein n=1 Tax=Lachnoclostridium phytofermentans TaxID=66219 RepID=A0A3D2X9N4_9FIRM|nr:hypothetical protein [Lachnoclostridium phytofermentans]
MLKVLVKMLSCLMVTGGNRRTAICEYMYNCDGRSLIKIFVKILADQWLNVMKSRRRLLLDNVNVGG